MKIFTLLAIFFALNCSAQNQKGYYIDTAGQRTEGFFKTTDFYDEAALEFSESPDGNYTTLDPLRIQEYGINDQFKFRKFNIKIDWSSTNAKRLSNVKEPEWQQKTVFLNVIAEGEATLYSYESKGVLQFFYSVANKKDAPEALVHKKYTPDQSSVIENNQFRQQLYANLNCGNKPIDGFLKVQYTKKALVDVFRDYNSCSQSQMVEYSNSTSKKIKAVYTVYAGIGNSTWGIESKGIESGTNGNLTFSAGGEVSFRVPSDKWELFIRGEYSKLSGDINYKVLHTASNARVRYKLDGYSINAYVGPRYNFLIKGDSKAFVDGAIGIYLPSGTIEYSTYTAGSAPVGAPNVFDVKSGFFGSFGLGYVFSDKYGICLRYDTNRNLFSNQPIDKKTQLTQLAINLRYSF